MLSAYFIKRYSVVKVLFSLLTSERCYRVSQGHRSHFNQFLFFDKAARLIARPVDLPQRCCLSSFSPGDPCLPNSIPYSFFPASSSVEMAGFEPAAFALQRRCSPAELHPQASLLVGLTGFEPVTPALSAQCSNQLSYKPDCCSGSTTEK